MEEGGESHREKCYDDKTETSEVQVKGFVTKEVMVTAWSLFTSARYRSQSTGLFVHEGK